MVQQEFDEAKARLASLKADPGNDAKLKLYALYKQVIHTREKKTASYVN